MSSSSFEFINPRYLSGITDEPKQVLQPIAGYACEPLLPLEDACEPLMTIVPRLSAHIWVAKQNAKNPADGLTQDESAAIHLYTMEWDSGENESRGSLYAHLNRTLKQIDRTKLRPWFRYLKLFLTALAKLPMEPRQTVWRGVRKNHSEDYPPDVEATWWAFSSCTTSLSVLESNLYLGNVGTRTLFSIETSNARTIRAHSHFKVEDEILLLPGTLFEVKSRLNPAPDLYIIHLSQKRPPYDLLEPPFEGAQLFPLSEVTRDTRSNSDIVNKVVKDVPRPWYKKKTVRFGIAAIVIAIILAVVLGTVLGARPKEQKLTNIITTTSTVPPMVGLYGVIPSPVSVADAFYAFDDNTLDLYSRRNGEVIDGSVSYVQGYVAYGKAISLYQSIAMQIQLRPEFNIDTTTSFTVEGFFLLQKIQLNATLVQLTPTITMNLINGVLTMSLGSNVNIIGPQMISCGGWHHLSFVYDATLQMATIYIDGNIEATKTSLKPDVTFNKNNSFVIVGDGFQGYIDQLSISLKAKSHGVILWDATTAGYYPLDIEGSWLLDKGPNGVNAIAANIQSAEIGWLNTSLRLNTPGAYYQINGFSPREKPTRSFSFALWVRAETHSGIFLTITNPYRCVLAMGLRNNDNSIIVYLPNSTASEQNVNILGIPMPINQWAHVAFTWDIENRANLYQSAYRQDIFETSESVVKFNRGADNASLPIMTVTLGKYNGPLSCQGIDGINISEEFSGSLDELYVFTRQLTQPEIYSLSTAPKHEKT